MSRCTRVYGFWNLLYIFARFINFWLVLCFFVYWLHHCATLWCATAVVCLFDTGRFSITERRPYCKATKSLDSRESPHFPHQRFRFNRAPKTYDGLVVNRRVTSGAEFRVCIAFTVARTMDIRQTDRLCSARRWPGGAKAPAQPTATPEEDAESQGSAATH